MSSEHRYIGKSGLGHVPSSAEVSVSKITHTKRAHKRAAGENQLPRRFSGSSANSRAVAVARRCLGGKGGGEGVHVILRQLKAEEVQVRGDVALRVGLRDHTCDEGAVARRAGDGLLNDPAQRHLAGRDVVVVGGDARHEVAVDQRVGGLVRAGAAQRGVAHEVRADLSTLGHDVIHVPAADMVLHLVD